MRILLVSSAKHFGGGERHLIDLGRGLIKRGHDVFVALRPSNQWQSRLDFIPESNILHVSIRNSFGMFSANRIGRFINANNIDIIHAHVARDYLPASVAARIGRNSRFVLTRHVMFPMKPFYRYALNNVDAAVAVSEGVRNELSRVIDRQKIRVIHNGLDVSPLENANAAAFEFRKFNNIPDDAVLIGTVGELKVLKGQRDLVLAANEVVKKIDNAYFLIMGVDNAVGQPFRRELKRLAEVLGIGGRFVWLDWMNDSRPAFAAMDIFVSPSHSESFGLAMLEAMSAGKPVVATETEGARTLLGKNAALVSVANPVELAASISRAAALPEEAASVGAELRETAAREFSLERFIDEHDKLYRSLKP